MSATTLQVNAESLMERPGSSPGGRIKLGAKTIAKFSGVIIFTSLRPATFLRISTRALRKKIGDV